MRDDYFNLSYVEENKHYERILAECTSSITDFNEDTDEPIIQQMYMYFLFKDV